MFTKEIQAKIQAALDDAVSPGKIDLDEMRKMKLTNKEQVLLMNLLAGNPDLMGDGFIRKQTNNGSVLISKGQPRQGVTPMSESDKKKFRAKYNNNEINEGFLKDGLMYFRNEKGELIRGEDGEYISERMYVVEEKLPFLNEDGTIDNEKFYEYIKSLPPATKSYTELMKEIELQKKMEKFHAVDKKLAEMKQDFVKAIREKDYTRAASIGLAGLVLAISDATDIGKRIAEAKEVTNMAMDNAVQKFIDADKRDDLDGKIEAFTEGFAIALQQIDSSIGITQAKEFLKSASGLRVFDTLMTATLDDGDNQNLSALEESWAAVEGAGKGIEGFIGAQGAAFIAVLSLAGEAAAAKGLGMAFSIATQAYFGFEGTKSIVEGGLALADAETKDEAYAAGEAIGVGAFMLHGTAKTTAKISKPFVDEVTHSYKVHRARKYMGIEEDTPLTEDVIKAAYKKSVVKYHPDRGGSDEAIAELDEAHELLKAELENLRSDVQGVKEGVSDSQTAMQSGENQPIRLLDGVKDGTKNRVKPEAEEIVTKSNIARETEPSNEVIVHNGEYTSSEELHSKYEEMFANIQDERVKAFVKARIDRFVDMRAPECIIENETKIAIRDMEAYNELMDFIINTQSKSVKMMRISGKGKSCFLDMMTKEK